MDELLDIIYWLASFWVSCSLSSEGMPLNIIMLSWILVCMGATLTYKVGFQYALGSLEVLNHITIVTVLGGSLIIH